jgi:hypothetical protein
MIYISPNNEYPRHIGDIQLEHPTYELGQELPEGWVQVEEASRPEVEQGQVAYEGSPVEIDGVMTQNWQVRNLTEEELERINAPQRAKEKLLALGLTEAEVVALSRGL